MRTVKSILTAAVEVAAIFAAAYVIWKVIEYLVLFVL